MEERDKRIILATEDQTGGYLGRFHPKGGAAVMDDLPEQVHRYITAHMIYHLDDYAQARAKGKRRNKTWGEVKALVVPGLEDPLGLAATIIFNAKDKERRRFYRDLFTRKVPTPPIDAILKDRANPSQ